MRTGSAATGYTAAMETGTHGLESAQPNHRVEEPPLFDSPQVLPDLGTAPLGRPFVPESRCQRSVKSTDSRCFYTRSGNGPDRSGKTWSSGSGRSGPHSPCRLCTPWDRMPLQARSPGKHIAFRVRPVLRLFRHFESRKIPHLAANISVTRALYAEDPGKASGTLGTATARTSESTRAPQWPDLAMARVFPWFRVKKITPKCARTRKRFTTSKRPCCPVIPTGWSVEPGKKSNQFQIQACTVRRLTTLPAGGRSAAGAAPAGMAGTNHKQSCCSARRGAGLLRDLPETWPAMHYPDGDPHDGDRGCS